MKQVFNVKNFYTVLYIISIYAILIIVLEDVLKDKAFHLELKIIPIIIVFTLFYFWVKKSFFKESSFNLSKSIILIILISSITLSLILQTKIKVKEVSDFSLQTFKNPLYQDFIKIANQHNLDLSFTKKAWIQRGPNNFMINNIFKEEAKSIDIIFFGDSTIAWGLIPKVIEQITGKRVAVYAYESNLLTVKSSQLFNKISKYYLKDNGIVLFSFDNWTQDKDPNKIGISVNEYKKIMKWENEDFQKLTQVNTQNFYEKYLSFKSFKERYDETSEYLKIIYGLSLKSPQFYETYLEPYINPSLHNNKLINKNEKTKFIRWDMDTITEYNKHYHHKSTYSDALPKQPIVDNNIKLNSKATSEIYGQNKVYIVPLTYKKTKYSESRNIYYSYYNKLDFELCDLGILHPKKGGYTMQGKSHMGNTGGLMQSILIAKWINNYNK